MLHGVVLRADRPSRLSYTLGEVPDAPSAYVTWEVQPAPTVTAVCLFVDEPDPGPISEGELEAIWLPNLQEAQALFERAHEDSA